MSGSQVGSWGIISLGSKQRRACLCQIIMERHAGIVGIFDVDRHSFWMMDDSDVFDIVRFLGIATVAFDAACHFRYVWSE